MICEVCDNEESQMIYYCDGKFRCTPCMESHLAGEDNE